jgi:hypothetical protein
MVSRTSVDGRLMDDDSDEKIMENGGRGREVEAVLVRIAWFGDCKEIEYSGRPYLWKFVIRE